MTRFLIDELKEKPKLARWVAERTGHWPDGSKFSGEKITLDVPPDKADCYEIAKPASDTQVRLEDFDG